MTARTARRTAGTDPRHRLRRAGVAALGLPLVLLAAPATALAPLTATDATTTTDGDVSVTNTETVQAQLDASGRLEVARLYEQLAFSGKGTTTVVNPTSTQGLRNLDGFGGFSTSDGAMTATVTVDGEKRLRTVSDFTGDLPVGVEVHYRLNGKEVDPGRVVGADGTLKVRYTVSNLTTRQDPVTYDDGTGTQVTTTAETVVPLVGQLTTTLPSTFTAVASDEANIAGDGRGGTKLSFTMTLFPPIGSPTAEFGYTAEIENGQVPAANVSVLPVSPLTSPSFAGGAASYAGGAESGQELTAGATAIDGNLLALRDGAATLLDGLLQLQDGAAQLSAGLNGEAAPGARTLAAGLVTARTGASDLAAGAATANGGARQVADGAAALDAGLTQAGQKVPSLLDGLNQVQGGLTAVDQGLATMSGSIGGLPENQGVIDLHNGIASLQTGVTNARLGAKSMSSTIGSLAAVLNGLGATHPTLTLAGAADPRYPAVVGLNQFLSAVAAGETDPVKKVTLQAVAAMYTVDTGPVDLGPGMQTLASVLSSGIVTGLGALQCGLDRPAATAGGLDCAASPSVAEGLGLVDEGLGDLVDEVVKSVQGGVGQDADTQASGTLRGGITSLQDGTAQIVTGAQALVSGLGQLQAGAGKLSSGSSQLADGTARLSGGAAQLSSGTSRLATGAGDLADGLGDAADGAEQLSEGLTQAADGAPALVDGATQLSEQGTSVLAASGAETAADYGVKYAVIEAGAQRTAEESMAYGGPEGAASVTAYSLDLAAVDGSGVTSVGRGAAALALFGIGATVATLWRRRLV
ncbi:hypothetical protein [Cellulomonas soli]|uniref:X-X-X-Leu-X-X-Gly heptad repeat-containing protein n=1 Tax=Cellulomonas soli TaxID=931535 RepID=A0A512PCM3_9CELL|nr:hypothetical protein [Cellulomonas soli]NYI58529.1 putative membrane protein [Cellulomonas soli]GEP68954.1 hypothetical protein CSO01_16690 [Cellulomonas soli]